MRTGLTLLQSNLLDADVKTDVSWLFEVDATGDGSVDYYWSTKAKTWSGQAYTYKVMDFSPIRLERNRSEYGVSPPSTFSFTITNEDATLLTSDFSGGNVTVRCVVKADLSGKFAPTDVASTDVTEEGFTEIEGEVFTFNFDMMTVSAQYQTLSFECRDWFTKYLEGSYPNTSSLSYLWPSIENNGGTCVPVIYGTVYIPLYSAFITDDRYYILGAAGPTFTITKSRSPIEIPITTEWLPASYTFTQATKAGADGNNYRVFRLFGTTTSEEESSNVIYRFFGRTETVTRAVNLGTDYLSLPTKFSQSTTVSTTAPTDIINSILQDMGIPSARIDATTKATCATTHTSWGLTWNVGLFNVEDRKTILARLLQNCHMELVVRDKIYFKIHSKMSQRDIERDMVIRGTFSYQGLVPERSNCGYVLYPHPSEDVPLNKLVKVLVPAKSTATIRSDYEVSCYYVPSSANAQTLGSLALQRKLLPSATISFSAKGKILQQEPDDVITIKPTDYGAPSGSSYPVLIDSFVIEKDLQVMVTATRFSVALDDWENITPSTVTITTDTSEYAYSPIMAGPDSTGQTGTAIPNRVPGKFIIGNETNYISFDPVIPVQKFVETGTTRMEIGNIGTIAVPDYGIEIFDAAGTSIFKLDGAGGATGNLFCGWSLAANTITCASGVVGLNSEVTVGTDWRIWAGNATAASAPFRVDEDGNLVAAQATITGSITATSGAIGGWDITTGYIYNLQSGTPTSSPNDGIVLASGNEAIIVYEDTAKRIELGYLAAGIYGLKGYATDGSTVVFELSDTQMKIAGWTIDSTSLTSVSGGNTTIVSSGATAFTAGPTGSPTFTVTQAGVLTATSGTIGGCALGTTSIGSTIFTSGPLGVGWNISNTGTAEFQNVIMRGILRTSVFEKDTISAINGVIIISKADILNADMTALDASTVTITGETAFVVNEVLRIKDGTDDEWMLVTDIASAPTYTVTRDLAAAYAANTNPIWKKGTAIVSMGIAGGGFIVFDASTANASPVFQVFKRTSATYNDYAEKIRIGNLYGSYGIGNNNYYGIGIGTNDLSGNYLRYDENSGDLIIAGDIKTSPTVGTTKGVHLSTGDNELYFYGDRGDTTIEKLLSIGPESTAIISSGTYNASSRIALLGYAKNSQAFSGSVIMNNSGTDGSAGYQFLLTPILTSASTKVFDNIYVQISRSVVDGYSLGGMRGINVYAFVGNGSGAITAVDGIKVETNFQNSTGIVTYKALNITKNVNQTVTPTNYYAIYQDDTTPVNFLAGYTLAKGGIRIGTTATDPGDNNLYVEGTSTFANNITIGNGKSIGQAAGPLLTFSDTNDRLNIEGCSVRIGTGGGASSYLHVSMPSGGGTDVSHFTTSDWVNGSVGSGMIIQFSATTGDTIDTQLAAMGTGGTTWNNLILQSGGGKVFIGDTANANMTTGLTINQGANDNEILSLKSSDVTHGITSLTETDTYAYFTKASALTGGLDLIGLTEDEVGIELIGVSTNVNTVTSTSAQGAITTQSHLKNGISVTSFAADDNIFCVRNLSSAKFIVKGDGDIYYDGVDQGSYDIYDDALACQDLSYNLSNRLSSVLKYNKKKLHEMGVIAHTVYDNGREDIFVSRKGMDMLQLGAIGELYRVCNVLCEKLGITFEEAKLLI